MDSALLHRFLDVGIELHLSIVKHKPVDDAEGIGVVAMDRQVLDEIIHKAGLSWDIDDARFLFEYILTCLLSNFDPPNAFQLADCVHIRYIRRVEGKDDMAPNDPLGTISP